MYKRLENVFTLGFFPARRSFQKLNFSRYCDSFYVFIRVHFLECYLHLLKFVVYVCVLFTLVVVYLLDGTQWPIVVENML